MKHLYQNNEGEMVAADSVEQAAGHHDCELGGAELPQDGWSQVPDGAVVPIRDCDSDKVEKKTAVEWAEDYASPTQVATTYF